MKYLYIIIILLIVILTEYYIYTDTNNTAKYHYKINNNSKIIIIGNQHGNEPATGHAIKQINDEIENNILKLKNGELIMYPNLNKYGLMLNYRYIPSIFKFTDLNRLWFNNKKSNFILIEKIKDEIKDASLVIDGHEGWGYHISNNKSMGSCIYCTHKFQIPQCDKIVNILNQSITNPDKKFLSRGITNDLLDKPALRTYCMQNNIPNILIETTGHNNIQSLELRKKQQYNIIIECLKNYNML